MAACLFGASATIASASTDSSMRCSSSEAFCHASGPGATVAASVVSTTSTSATYNLAMTASTGSAWAVFDGSSRVANAATPTGAFTGEYGKTYDIFAVDLTSGSFSTTSVSPVAAVVPTSSVEPTPSVEPTGTLDESTPPVTTSDAVASYSSRASIKLTSTDGAGHGVAYIYYSIDGARVHMYKVGMVPQTTFTIDAPLKGTATHTIEFWAQDDAGNVEAPNSATLTIDAPAAPVVRVRAKLMVPSTPWYVNRNAAFTTSGYLTPRHEAGSRVVAVCYYRLINGKFVYYKTVKPALANSIFDNYSQFRFTTSLPYAGKWRVRSIHAADALHTNSYSGYHNFTVR